MKIIKETTSWRWPKHTYHLDDSGRLVAYIREGTEEVIEFSRPLSFERRGRKFKTIKAREVRGV